jgi:hypothetical protein
MSNRITRRGVAVIAAAGALLTVTFVAAPQADASTIYACVKKKSGGVRIVSNKTKCRKSELKLSWSSSGRSGANGKNGASGPQGSTGKEGAPGKEGAKGNPGPGIKWALVKADGTSIIAQSGGISISSHFTGGYYLDFGSRVAGHAISATIWDGGGGFPPGALSVAPCGEGTPGATPDTLECVVPGTNDVNHVFVTTLNTAGTQTDKPFYIEVFE